MPLSDDSECVLQSANGSPLELVGTADISLNILGLIIPHTVTVCRRLTENCILGRQFLHGASAVLNFKDGTVTFSDFLEIPLQGRVHSSAFIRACDAICITPKTEAVFAVQVHPKFNGQDVLITPLERHQLSPYLVANSIACVRRGRAFCRLLNYRDTNLVICKGQKLGKVELFGGDQDCLLIKESKAAQGPEQLPDEVSEKDLNQFAAEYRLNIGQQLAADTRLKLLRLLYQKRAALARSIDDLKVCKGRQFELKLKSDKPVYQRQYRQDAFKARILQQHIDEYARKGIIERSEDFDFNVPWFLVPKQSLKTATDPLDMKHYRPVADLRRVNLQLQTQIVMTPSVIDVVDQIAQFAPDTGEGATDSNGDQSARNCTFTCCDFYQGYHQLELTPQSRKILSFTSPNGERWRLRRLPMGASVSCAIWNSLMNQLFGPMKAKGGLSIYFDDAIIYTRDDQTHLQKLSEFLQILIDNDLKCSVTKSFWMHDRIRYLGLDIGPEGISVPAEVSRTLDKMATVQIKTKKQILSFLGFFAFWRIFLPNLAQRTRHLREASRKDVPFAFTPECEAERQDLIAGLRNVAPLQPIFPDRPLWLIVDSSRDGVGISICQEDQSTAGDPNAVKRQLDNLRKGAPTLRPIRHISYAATAAQKNYSSADLELTGVVRALQTLDHFAFTELHFVSDNIAVCAFQTLRAGTPRQRRLIAYIQNYSIFVHYIPGKMHKSADFLSRLPEMLSAGEKVEWQPRPEDEIDNFLMAIAGTDVKVASGGMACASEVGLTAVDEACQYSGGEVSCGRSKTLRADAPVFVPTQVGGVQVVGNQEQPKADSAMSMNGVCDVRFEAVDAIQKTATDVTTAETGQGRRDEQQQTGLPQMPVFADLEIKAEDYQNDAAFAPMYVYLTEQRLTGDKETDYRTLLLAELYVIDSEKLYKLVLPRSRKRKVADSLPSKVLVIPKKFENAVLTSLHAITGHAGAQKMYDLARLYVCMPRLFEGCTLAATSCQRCQQTKFDRRQQIAPLRQMPVFQVGTTWVLDFKNLPRKTSQGHRYVLALVETYSHWSYFELLYQADALSTARAIIRRILPEFPQINSIISDRGSQFTSRLFQHLTTAVGIKSWKSASLNPRSHGLVEGVFSQLAKWIKAFADTDSQIADVIPLIELVQHVSVSRTLGYSPFQILRGYQPDIHLFTESVQASGQQAVDPDHYVEWLTQHLALIRKDVEANKQHAHEIQKRAFDKQSGVREPNFQEGERVYLLYPNPRAHSESVLTHKQYKGPFFITKVCQRESTVAKDDYPTLRTAAMGKAYQLTSCETGKVLRALVPSSRLKRCVDRSTFDKVHPPLNIDRQKDPDETDTQSKKQSAVGAERRSPQTPSPGTEAHGGGPEWWPAKNIVRKRLTAGKLEFLVKFRDNTKEWRPPNGCQIGTCQKN
jgi:transposase InsO family protein